MFTKSRPRFGRTVRTAVLLGAVLPLALAACSGGGDSKTPGVTDDVIKIGEITAGTGPVAVFGNGITNGQRAYFERVNAEGGVGGRRIELIVEDSQYDVQKAVSAYAKIADDVAVMGQIIGTPSTNALLDSLAKDNLLVAPSTSALSLSENPLTILVSTPYAVDMLNVATYGVENLGLGNVKWGTLTPEDDFGVDHRIGASKAADFFNLDMTDVKYRPGDTDFTAQIQRLKDANVEAVLVGSIGSTTTQLLGAAKQLNYNPTWLSSNPAWVSAFADVPEANALFTSAKFYMASPFQAWGAEGPGMAQMLADHEKYTPKQPEEIYFIMGYAQARVIHSILLGAEKSGDFTRDGLRAAYAGVGEVELGELLPNLTYEGATGIPTRETRIFTFDKQTDGFLKQLTDLAASQAAMELQVGDSE